MPKPALLLLALALAAPAAAAPKGEPRPGEKRICRPAAAPLGSRIKRPGICRSAAEWEDQDSARRAADIPVKPAQAEPWERTRPQ